MKPAPKEIAIPDDIAARYTNADQAERMEMAVRKVFSMSPERADMNRGESSVSPNPSGRQPKGEVAPSRAPVAVNVA